MATSASLRFPTWKFVKKEAPAMMFFCELCKILRTSFDRTPPNDCFMCLSENLEKFLEHLLHRAPLGQCIFYAQGA